MSRDYDPRTSLDFRLGPDQPWITIGYGVRSEIAYFWRCRPGRWSGYGPMFNAIPSTAVSPRFNDLRRVLGMAFEEREVPSPYGSGRKIMEFRLADNVEIRITQCGRCIVYRLIATGRLRADKVRGQWAIATGSLDAMLKASLREAKPTQGSNPRGIN